MDLTLVNAQSGIKSSCVIILEKDIKLLKGRVVMRADISDKALFGMEFGTSIFKEKLERVSCIDAPSYFVITGIDEQGEQVQNRFIGLVKDREINGYNLPHNVVIVFAVKDKNSIKNISSELYGFCTVAI